MIYIHMYIFFVVFLILAYECLPMGICETVLFHLLIAQMNRVLDTVNLFVQLSPIGFSCLNLFIWVLPIGGVVCSLFGVLNEV